MFSGNIFFNRNGLCWRDAAAEYGPHKTLYKLWKRWSDKGILARMMAGLAAGHCQEKAVMINATYLRAHRTATSMVVKKGAWTPDPAKQRPHDTKLYAICDSQGRPLNLFVIARQVIDYIVARALLSSLLKVDWLLGDRGYCADWFREAWRDKGIRACIPRRKQRKKPVKYNKRRYKRRNRIEIMLGRLEDSRRVATRYDMCSKVFLSAIALSATIIY